MPAKDRFHDALSRALNKDGWTITHDPFTISYGQKDVFVDLGAERLVAAERGTEKIAVELKNFLGQSEMRDLEVAVDQYAVYRALLARVEPERRLYLAVPDVAYTGTLSEAIARPVLEDYAIAIVTFDPQREVITRWTPTL